jgi:hypothetical protein
MTLLTIVQDVLDRTRLFDTPTSVIGNTDTNVKAALVLLEELGFDLMKQRDWNVLQREQTLALIASQEAYDLTASAVITNQDFDRFLEDTDWDRTNFRKMFQVNPEDWQILKSSTGTSAEINRFIRRRGNDLIIHPTPSAADTIVFEYISTKWITSSGTDYDTFQADTDTTYFPEHLLKAGLTWKLKENFGQKHATDLSRYEQLLANYAASDTPARTLNTGFGDRRPVANIQDTDFG